MQHTSASNPDLGNTGRRSDKQDGRAKPGGDARIWALIPCAGRGTRAGATIAKQYQQIAGMPLVFHTIAAFAAVQLVEHTLIAVAQGDGFWLDAASQQSGPWSVAYCGGDSRAATVANGLAALQAAGAADDDWVLVHDAARCLVTADLIERLINACLGDPVGGLLAHPVTDTLKRACDGRVAATPDRSTHWTAQTPQMFRCAALRRALYSAGDAVTDESSAMESLGHSPLLVPGSASNFKVTFAQDFVLAQAILLERAKASRKDLDYDYP